MSTKRTILTGGSLLALLAVVLRRGTALRRALDRAVRRGRGRARHAAGRLRGARHRLLGRRGTEPVADPVLADRVRAELGRVTHQLDLPHVHVMAQDGMVLLHGDVGTEPDREAVEAATRRTPGVRGVESYLHVGLLPGDTRPSEGRAVHPPSDARRRLELAAKRGGAVGQGEAARAVRAVLAAFVERIPAGEREQVLTHLPADVRALTRMPRRLGGTATRLRTVDQLVATVSGVEPELGATRARLVTDAVLGELAALVPEEQADVSAILPPELRRLWERGRSPRPTT